MNILPPATRERFCEGLALGGRSLFRLWIGLGGALTSLEILEPRNLFGPGKWMGRAAMIAVLICGLALRGWGSRAPKLATHGPYSMVRNPIYLGSLLLGFGMCVLIGDPLAFACCGGVFALIYLTIIPAEEKYLLHRFGPDYRDYCSHVRRFLPRWSLLPAAPWRDFHWSSIIGEWQSRLILIGIYVALLGEEYRDDHWHS